MSATTPATRQHELPLHASPADVCGVLRTGQACTLLLDSGVVSGEGWSAGPLVAVDPAWRAWRAGRGAEGLAVLARTVAERRARGGTAETGVAAVLSYEALVEGARSASPTPDLLVLAVDRSLRFDRRGAVRVTLREGKAEAVVEAIERALGTRRSPAPATALGRAHTSLPRKAYIAAVERVLDHIGAGDIYQANLCQRFEVRVEGDPFEAYTRLSRATPAPRAAFVEAPGLALASVSPETFLHGAFDALVETWPIKGTRPRGCTPEEDAALAAALVRSEKDRAELLMIVDLERNDLSRVCRAGSVGVPELATLRSYHAVHHLVARVVGRLAPSVTASDLVRATFPGGSISGAPKRRAMEILRTIEPVPRGWFTGSLCWFGDDGTFDSSILIRSWVFADGQAWLGAGGGVVADSDPLEEWQESNHKARALARVLGFEPEEAA